jgi:hypothetical protein
MRIALPLRALRALRLQSLPQPIASSSRLPAIPNLRIRSLTTSPTALRNAPSFSRPGPPPLPAADQAEFEELVKANQTVGTAPAQPEVSAGDMEHRDIRRGARPQFEGEVNPATGEKGGPKVDPFIAGDGDWQFGGRVTVSARQARHGGGESGD